jgi:hypothetical protein
MTRFRTQVDWSAPTAPQRAQRIARELILDLVVSYQKNGNAALGHYDDLHESMAVGEQFHGVVSSTSHLPIPVPDLMGYLVSYPQGRPARAHEFFYWSVVEFGLKPTVRVNHVIIYPMLGSPRGVRSSSCMRATIFIRRSSCGFSWTTTAGPTGAVSTCCRSSDLAPMGPRASGAPFCGRSSPAVRAMASVNTWSTSSGKSNAPFPLRSERRAAGHAPWTSGGGWTRAERTAAAAATGWREMRA